MASWDMRELARTERSLAELNHELEARVRARTAELEAANQSLRMEADAHARTERALDESRILLQSMTDNSPSVIYAKDLEGRYLFVNPRFVELFGGTIAETIGKTDFDVAPREAAEGYREMDRRVISLERRAGRGRERHARRHRPHLFVREGAASRQLRCALRRLRRVDRHL